jgi:hypothetical protein
MAHPYTNMPPPSIVATQTLQSMPLEQKKTLLKKCKFVIDTQIVEQKIIEEHLIRHKDAWNIIYPCNSKAYTPPEDFIKELNKHKSYITELQYRYTILEMFM